MLPSAAVENEISGARLCAGDRPAVLAPGDDHVGGHPIRGRLRRLGRGGGDGGCQRHDRHGHRDRRRRVERRELLVERGQQGRLVHGATVLRRGDAERPALAGRHGGVDGGLVDRRGEGLDGGRQLVAVVGDGGVEGHAVDRGLGCADEVREGLALAACRECRVDQRRGVGAAADVGIADGRHLAVRAGERDLPVAERPIGARDLRLRLLAGEPAEVRAADADAGQDPAVVLLAPCVQDAGADADGEHEADDERDAEAEGERPSAPRPCRGLAVGHGGHGAGPARYRRRARSRRRTSAAARRRRRHRASRVVRRCVGPTSAASSGSPAGVSPSGVEALAAPSAAELGRSVIRCSCAVGRRRASSPAAATSSRVHANLSRDGRLGWRD